MENLRSENGATVLSRTIFGSMAYTLWPLGTSLTGCPSLRWLRWSVVLERFNAVIPKLYIYTEHCRFNYVPCLAVSRPWPGMSISPRAKCETLECSSVLLRLWGSLFKIRAWQIGWIWVAEVVQSIPVLAWMTSSQWRGWKGSASRHPGNYHLEEKWPLTCFLSSPSKVPIWLIFPAGSCGNREWRVSGWLNIWTLSQNLPPVITDPEVLSLHRWKRGIPAVHQWPVVTPSFLCQCKTLPAPQTLLLAL